MQKKIMSSLFRFYLLLDCLFVSIKCATLISFHYNVFIMLYRFASFSPFQKMSWVLLHSSSGGRGNAADIRFIRFASMDEKLWEQPCSSTLPWIWCMSNICSSQILNSVYRWKAICWSGVMRVHHQQQWTSVYYTIAIFLNIKTRVDRQLSVEGTLYLQ